MVGPAVEMINLFYNLNKALKSALCSTVECELDGGCLSLLLGKV